MAGNSGRPFEPNDPRINRNGPAGNHGIGFAKRIRAATKDGQDLLDFAKRVMDGTELDTYVLPNGNVVKAPAPLKVRFEAAKWLGSRGYGKELPFIPNEDDGRTLSDEELLAGVVDSVALSPRLLEFMQKRILSLQQSGARAQ